MVRSVTVGCSLSDFLNNNNIAAARQPPSQTVVMASWEELVAVLQPKRGKRGFAAKMEEGRVAAALMLAQDRGLSASFACDRCGVPAFRSKAANVANTIKQLGMQDVRLPEKWTVSELTDPPMSSLDPTAQPKGKHTPVREQASSAQQPSPPKSARRMLEASLPPSLAQPVSATLTPERRNVELVLQAASPGGTIVAQATYKRAAATPEGEDADARAKRLDAERHRLLRARGRLNKQLQQQRSISMRELDAALDNLDDAGGLWQDGKLTRQIEVSEERRMEVYEKFRAAKYSCAVELVGLVEALTVEEVYALYPCNERPEYHARSVSMVGLGLRRPEEHRCACGSKLRFECRCDQCALNLAVRLEREQDGDEREYGVDQAYEWSKALRKWIDEGEQGEEPKASNYGVTTWWEGFAHGRREPGRHEKSMHLADRLVRSFPGVLISESDHAMAVYRRVSATDLILENWERR